MQDGVNKVVMNGVERLPGVQEKNIELSTAGLCLLVGGIQLLDVVGALSSFYEALLAVVKDLLKRRGYHLGQGLSDDAIVSVCD